ncbi:MAG TPA: L,D-transpeptidase family protein [Candidatus Eisenbacteria bacterium]|nr:L,D-transpeptidase family protein [Candidatus Eisenbacteria bacterium]
MLSLRNASIPALFVLLILATANYAPAPPGVAERVQVRLPGLEQGSLTLCGERLWQPKALARFYKARQARPAWGGRDAEDIVQAIRGVTADGLNPGDYHLKTIEQMVAERENGSTPELEGDLDILLSDAVAAIADHVRYGRVKPVTLNAAWNVDPREGAPPLEQQLAEIRSAPDLSRAIQARRPDHFIYRGLVRELASLRDIEDQGGWPRVASGRPVAPGGRDERIAGVRRRLEASGDYRGGAGADPSHYDASLAKAVRQFQELHRIPPDGVIGPTTVAAMNVPVQARINQVRANLERARWVLNGLHDDFLLVNIPAFKAYLIRDQRRIWEARTQVGDEYMKTPTFRSMMQTVVFNPDWTVPASIAKYEVLDAMRNGDNVLLKWGLRVYDRRGREVHPASVNWDAPPERFPYTLRQLPGSRNPLGRVKFLFPNKYSIYLHDTPNKRLFAARDRTFSHGCIRVENAMELADLLLRDQIGTGGVRNAVAEGATRNVALEHPIPVLIVYWTVSVGAKGDVHYANDIYGYDAPLAAALNAGRRG